jgi:dTMP kinase
MVDPMQGRLFVFEGPDDVGKTTLAGLLSEYLSSAGQANKMLSFPGREQGTVSELIYRLYHDPACLGVSEITPIALQVMVTAAHIEVIEARIKPMLGSGVDVVLDRFWWSTWVYATLEGVPLRSRDLMLELEMQSWGSIQPKLIFFVLRKEPLLQQPDNNQWLEKVKLYKQLVKLQKDKLSIELVLNDCSPSEVLKMLVSRISSCG